MYQTMYLGHKIQISDKGGEQSERTPPECSVKWPPMNENT